MRPQKTNRLLALVSICVMLFFNACSRKGTVPKAAPAKKVKVTANWDKTIAISKTASSFQVGRIAFLSRGTALYDSVYKDFRELGCDYVRTGTEWFCYPRRAILELEPPKDGKTSWDFSLMDAKMESHFSAMAGHSTLFLLSAIPAWMFKTEKPVPYPADPNQVDWKYEQGTELRDPSFKEVADYFARVVSWYTQGGFTDEYGHYHQSGHHYKFDYIEPLNEIDLEHHMTPETYTRAYDAIVAAVRKVDPQAKFVGLALAHASLHPRYFEYFLDHKNHKPATPIDMVDYHFYAHPPADEPPEMQQYTVFNQADGFLGTVRYVEAIKRRLSPKTMTDLAELGCIAPNDNGVPRKPIPNSWWNLSGAVYAYLYGHVAGLGIDVATQSELYMFPSMVPSVTMVNWNTGQPNARYWVLKLIHDNLGPGDKLVETASTLPYVYAQGFVTREGRRKLLLVNKRNRSFDLTIAGGSGAEVTYVDQATGFQPPVTAHLTGDQTTLRGFAVAIVSLPK